MLVADIRLQIFNETNDFCFTVFMKLFTLFNDTAVIKLLLTESDTNHIIKVNSHFKHRFKLGFTAYRTSEIMQQLTDVAESFPTIWEDHGLLVDLPKQD